MEQTIKDQLKDVVDLLKTTVHSNINTIKMNDKKLNELLKDQSSDKRRQEINSYREVNKKLMYVNKNAIQIQFDIINLLQKHSSVFYDMNLPLEEPDYEDYFQKTINKEVDFNLRHPFFLNEQFYNELLEHLTDKEEYEYCDLIVKRKKFNV